MKGIIGSQGRKGCDQTLNASGPKSTIWPRRQVLKAAISVVGAGSVFGPALVALARERPKVIEQVIYPQISGGFGETSNKELYTLSIEELGRRLSSKEISPVSLVNAYLERIQDIDKSINSFITVMAEQALVDARRSEQEILSGQYKGPLHGIPIALKDVYDVRGVPTTGGSRVFSGRIPEEDASSVSYMRHAGAIIIGKTNMYELGFVPVEARPTHNPWATDRITGGSSSGSSAAVAAGLCAGATGADAGGSIRIPAALCGVVGFKPTYGRISTRGLVTLSWTLDHPGPITRTVMDAALMLGAMAGYDPLDPASSDRPVPDFTAGIADGVRGLRIGVDPMWTYSRLQSDVKMGFEKALDVLRELKAEIVQVSMPRITEALGLTRTILSCEAITNFDELLQTRPQDFGDKVHARLADGYRFRAIDYARARHTADLLRRNLQEVFEKVSLIATPTCPITAPKMGLDSIVIDGKEDPVQLTLLRFTHPYNLTGWPAISVPCGFSQDGLPIGLELAGPAWSEATVLRAAYAYEKAANWRHNRPKAPTAGLIASLVPLQTSVEGAA